MAFKCQVTRVPLLNSSNNPWDEEVAATHSRSYIPCVASRKETQKSLTDVPTARKSISDLPPVLISEILHCLDAKELGIVSCVSTLFRKLASENSVWKEFYCERWGLPLEQRIATAPSEIPIPESYWKELFIERESRSKTFMGRYSIDVLYGHTEAVRSVFVLAHAKLVFSGGYDSVIRMWDVEEGLLVASSRPVGCTIRAIVADTELLVAGGTDTFLQCWRAINGVRHLFDITGSVNQNSEFRLWEHEGPVTCLALDSAMIYSGSWDMSIRIWDRARLKCLKVLRHGDWVWDLVPRGLTVASVAGSDAYIWDVDTGNQLRIIPNAHAGNVYSLARSHLGDLLFTGGEDGAVKMFEVHAQDVRQVATWIPHSGAVYSLAFEYPWLVSSSSDGKLALIDVRKLLRSSRLSVSRCRFRVNQLAPNNVEAPQRMLHGFGSNLFSVGIGVDRIVCAGEEGIVRIWNFSQALEIERRVRALRGMRLENRMRRRKAQMGTGSKSSNQADKCSVEAKRDRINGNRNNVWCRRGVSGKLKA